MLKYMHNSKVLHVIGTIKLYTFYTPNVIIVFLSNAYILKQ